MLWNIWGDSIDHIQPKKQFSANVIFVEMNKDGRFFPSFQFQPTQQELKAVVEDVVANVPEDSVPRFVATLRKQAEKYLAEGRSHFQQKMGKQDPCWGFFLQPKLVFGTCMIYFFFFSST